MNSRLLSIVVIIIAVGFVSNVLFVNSSFAEDSPARKAMKEKSKQHDEDKKAKIAEKKAALKAYKIKILESKLAKYIEKQNKNPNPAFQQRIDELNAQITALKNKP